MAQKNKRMSNDEKKKLVDNYQEQIDSYFLGLANSVSNRLVSDIEKGLPPWESPVMSTHFHNPESGVNYNFENSVLLWASTQNNDYESNKFVTAKQGFDAGLSLEKGTQGHKIVQRFGMPLGYLYEKDNQGNFKKDKNNKPIPERDDDGSPIQLYKRAAKLVTVFNIDQFKGNIPERWLKDKQQFRELNDEKEMALFRDVLEKSSECPIKRHKSNDNAYYPNLDTIKISDSELFKNRLVEVSTMAHEISHSTGHKDRLNRESLEKYSQSNYYRGYEEIVANFSARALTEKYNLPEKDIKESYLHNHDTYDMRWMIPVIKENIEDVFKATQDAERAYKRVNNNFQKELANEPKLKDFLDSKKEEPEPEPEPASKPKNRRRARPS